MTAAELAIHDVQVVSLGALGGLLLGYLCWKLPAHLRRINEWWVMRTWARQDVQAEVDRIRGMFEPEGAPLVAEQPWWLQRLVDETQADWARLTAYRRATWARFVAATAPRSAEQVAREYYQLHGG